MAKRKKVIKRFKRKVRYNFIYALLRAMMFISGLMSRAAWLKFCGALGRLSSVFTANSRKRVVEHLTMVYGKEKTPAEIKALSKKVFKMLGMNAGDIIQSVNISRQEDYEKFRVINGVEHCASSL
jgi:KDO2-lipid IV(A) lauroyltransferase